MTSFPLLIFKIFMKEQKVSFIYKFGSVQNGSGRKLVV